MIEACDLHTLSMFLYYLIIVLTPNEVTERLQEVERSWVWLGCGKTFEQLRDYRG